MSLPYTKTEAYQMGEKLYPTEQAALLAALEGVVGTSGIAATVLKEACKLSPLLVRACELEQGAGTG